METIVQVKRDKKICSVNNRLSDSEIRKLKSEVIVRAERDKKISKKKKGYIS